MKLKLGEIRDMIDVLPTVIDTDGLPTKTGYWLGRALVDLLREHAPYEEARQKTEEFIETYRRTDVPAPKAQKEASAGQAGTPATDRAAAVSAKA